MLDDIITTADELLEAVKKDGENIRLASYDLQDSLITINKHIAIEAVKQTIYALQFLPDELQKDEEILSYMDLSFLDKPESERTGKDFIKSNNWYFNMKDRDGVRYDIPMLDTTDPEYYWKYISYMKTKVHTPMTFQKIINWD